MPGSDAYTPYEAGLRERMDRLGKDHPRYSEALTFEQRLTENVTKARRLRHRRVLVRLWPSAGEA
jgi:hypothetical protein